MTASRFRTIELSDPRFERDELRLATVHSESLGGRGDITFFIPSELAQDLPAPAPLVVLLHGSCGSHWAWTLKGGVHLTARRLIDARVLPPLVIAMPSDGLGADSTGYIRHDDVDYEKWIVEDVVACAEEVVRSVTPASRRFLAGLSMGGFGAAYLGFKYPNHFAAVSAHSSVPDISTLKRKPRHRAPEIHRLRSDPELSIVYWAKKNKSALPKSRFDCGVDDHLISFNREMHQELTALGIEHRYEEFPGAHTWEYWSAHVEDSLRFFATMM